MEAKLMEDVDIVRKLFREAGPPAIVPASLLVSARRWDRLGYIRNTLSNLLILCAYKLGADPDFLATWYYR